MKIRIVGAGPAGLYFAALMKQHDPSHEITLFDRSARNATWGFGVVFSDRALEFLRADDEALYRYLTPHLETWPDITIVHNDTRIPIAGNGFASIGRLELLTLLYAYVEKLGLKINFETEVTNLEQFGDADLVVGANGAFSSIRGENEAKFGTTTQWRSNKFIWYGTSKAFDSLTLTFRETGCRRFLRPPLPLSARHEHIPGRGGRRDMAACRVQGHEPRGHHQALRAGVCEGPRGQPHHFQQLVLAQLPGHLERALEFR